MPLTKDQEQLIVSYQKELNALLPQIIPAKESDDDIIRCQDALTTQNTKLANELHKHLSAPQSKSFLAFKLAISCLQLDISRYQIIVSMQALHYHLKLGENNTSPICEDVTEVMVTYLTYLQNCHTIYKQLHEGSNFEPFIKQLKFINKFNTKDFNALITSASDYLADNFTDADVSSIHHCLHQLTAKYNSFHVDLLRLKFPALNAQIEEMSTLSNILWQSVFTVSRDGALRFTLQMATTTYKGSAKKLAGMIAQFINCQNGEDSQAIAQQNEQKLNDILLTVAATHENANRTASILKGLVVHDEETGSDKSLESFFDCIRENIQIKGELLSGLIGIYNNSGEHDRHIEHINMALKLAKEQGIIRHLDKETLFVSETSFTVLDCILRLVANCSLKVEPNDYLVVLKDIVKSLDEFHTITRNNIYSVKVIIHCVTDTVKYLCQHQHTTDPDFKSESNQALLKTALDISKLLNQQIPKKHENRKRLKSLTKALDGIQCQHQAHLNKIAAEEALAAQRKKAELAKQKRQEAKAKKREQAERDKQRNAAEKQAAKERELKKQAEHAEKLKQKAAKKQRQAQLRQAALQRREEQERLTAVKKQEAAFAARQAKELQTKIMAALESGHPVYDTLDLKTVRARSNTWPRLFTDDRASLRCDRIDAEDSSLQLEVHNTFYNLFQAGI